MIPVTYGSALTAKQKRSPRLLQRAGFLSARFIGIILLALLALLYIAQESQGASSNIGLQASNSEAAVLVEKQQQLELEALRLKSLDSISQSAPQLGLEPTESIEHLDALK